MVIPRFVRTRARGRAARDPRRRHADALLLPRAGHDPRARRADGRRATISGEIFNVGSTERIRILDLADRVLELHGLRVGARLRPVRRGLRPRDRGHAPPRAVRSRRSATRSAGARRSTSTASSRTSSSRRAAHRPPSTPDGRSRVVVTGGAGFIGSHVADAFLARGDDVLVVDDLSTGSARERAARRAGFEQLDIVEPRALEDAFAVRRRTSCCHLAAQASVTVSVEDPELDCRVERRSGR